MNITSFLRNMIFIFAIIACTEQNETKAIEDIALVSEKDSLKVESRIEEKTKDLSIEEILLQVYSEQIDSISNNFVYFRNGKKLLFDDKQEKDFEKMLTNSDVQDQFKQVYPLESDYLSKIIEDIDPGRIRSTEFFMNIYGRSASEVKNNSTTIDWFGRKLIVSKVNNVHLRLDSVKNDLLKLDQKFHKYFTKTAGTFNWRKIAGTERLSAHSFAVAIDINTEFAHYWLWNKPDKQGKYPYKNTIPYEIVEVFEKYGFIWGGKWYHYDTMHFEYRPELIIYSKIKGN